MSLSNKKIDELLQYILMMAGQSNGFDRELGMIHLIKYVYLVDLNYAKHREGKTYTGLKWKFHHFGPWSVDCFQRIEPALEAINANKVIRENLKHKDTVRWSFYDHELFEKFNDQMDLIIAGTVQKYVSKFGNDTYGLLDFVYKTDPMLNASPEETIDFKSVILKKLPIKNEQTIDKLTIRQRKKQKQKILAFKKQLNKRLDEKIQARKSSPPSLPPRYDNVYFDGVKELEESVKTEATLMDGEYLAIFTNDVWKSRSRHDPELS